MINDEGKTVNLLTLTRDMFAGNIKDVAIVLVVGFLLTYAVFFIAYLSGVFHNPPGLSSLISILFGQILLVTLALWLKKKYPK